MRYKSTIMSMLFCLLGFLVGSVFDVRMQSSRREVFHQYLFHSSNQTLCFSRIALNGAWTQMQESTMIGVYLAIVGIILGIACNFNHPKKEQDKMLGNDSPGQQTKFNH